jgi:hypothetical protein
MTELQKRLILLSEHCVNERQYNLLCFRILASLTNLEQLQVAEYRNYRRFLLDCLFENCMIIQYATNSVYQRV